MLQLVLANGAKLAIDPDTITGVQEEIDAKGNSTGTIVFAGGHKFATVNDFHSVYNDWVSQMPVDEGEETETGDGTETGNDPNAGQTETT